MNSETTKTFEEIATAGAVELAEDDVTEIDPAEFFDAEEFGIRRSESGR